MIHHILLGVVLFCITSLAVLLFIFWKQENDYNYQDVIRVLLKKIKFLLIIALQVLAVYLLFLVFSGVVDFIRDSL
ncbi:hypothetical protein TXIAM_30262 [Tenacibaculum xiamenense]